MPTPTRSDTITNVADWLARNADEAPEQVAIAEPTKRRREGRRVYRTVTFAELAADAERIARGLVAGGARRGQRLALLVPPSIEFVTLVFALLKSGAATILIDPGMGRRNLLRCLEEARPEGFVAIPLAQAIRRLYRGRFPAAALNVTVGGGWPLWGGESLEELRRRGESSEGRAIALPAMESSEPAAVIFTTGSTGPPKGVLYRHQNFAAQVSEIRDFYGIRAGEIDVPCFPLFGLFNAAMGVTTVLPRMDASRPARAKPARIVEAILEWQATQSFASPAVWNRVGPYCRRRGIRLPSLKRVLSAGAPVPARVLGPMQETLSGGAAVHTPYGATEALPVASISAVEVLQETWPQTRVGQGVCVGRRFAGIEWRVIEIVERPIVRIEEARTLGIGEIGELIVRGAVVTSEYVTRREANAMAKILDAGREAPPGSDITPSGEGGGARTGLAQGPAFWHRMGDCGYLDEQERFWFCGRAAHRVLTEQGPLYTIPCEAIFNEHPRVFRSALVGVGAAPRQTPVVVIEPQEGAWPWSRSAKRRFAEELRERGSANPLTRQLKRFLFRRQMPVDIRHNAKIFRERLAVWAAGRPTY